MLTSQRARDGESNVGLDKQINGIFDRYDTNGDGEIGAWELKAMIDSGEILVNSDNTVSLAVVALPTSPADSILPPEEPSNNQDDPFGLVLGPTTDSLF